MFLIYILYIQIYPRYVYTYVLFVRLHECIYIYIYVCVYVFIYIYHTRVICV